MENIKFCDLEVSHEIKKAIKEMGFEEATPVQSQSIIPIMEGHDVVAQAPTGTGKTCAFGIPLIEQVDNESNLVQGLILCPTRELVIQTTDELMKLARFKRAIKITPIYGGQQIDRQIFALKKRPQIIVATPGRLMDHMRRKTLKLDSLKYVILDEADEMLNMGFREDIDTILETVPETRQTILFSATLSKAILDITKKYLHDEILIKVTHNQITVPTVEQFYLETKSSTKIDVLTRIIDVKNYTLSMVFCNTKRMVDELTENLGARGYSAEGLHGDMKQSQRDKVMAKFKKGVVDILVATDVAARGIDVDDIEAVFNYDLPNDEEYYVHRIGRTGRANKTGVAYTFINHRELYKLKDIMRYTKSTIMPMKVPSAGELEDIRLGRVSREVFDIIRSEKHKEFISLVEKMIDDENSLDVTTLDIAAALISKEFPAEVANDAEFEREWQRSENSRSNGRGNESRYGDRNNDRGNDHGQRSSHPNDGNKTRLFLNIGTLDKIKKRHVLEIFKLLTTMDVREIDNIDIFDKYSFVTIPPECVENALLGLNGYDYRGRVISAEVANSRKKATGDRTGDRGGDRNGHDYRRGSSSYANAGKKPAYKKRYR